MKSQYLLRTSCLCLLVLFSACSGDDNSGSIIDQITGLTPANDVDLGQQIVTEIEANPNDYPILSRTQYPDAYAYIEAMTADILVSDAVNFRDLFPYEVTIIEDDETLNAFATPGGFIYVYTGLIKFLDQADDLAGVMGHEIAHSAERHSKEQLEKNLGLSFLASALGGGQATQLLGGLLGLQFSRSDETEADAFSVTYLSDTDYACNGAATFFEKLSESGGGGTPAFLSTHPSPTSRVEDINAKAAELGCSTTAISETGMTYEDFQNSLP